MGRATGHREVLKNERLGDGTTRYYKYTHQNNLEKFMLNVGSPQVGMSGFNPCLPRAPPSRLPAATGASSAPEDARKGPGDEGNANKEHLSIFHDSSDRAIGLNKSD